MWRGIPVGITADGLPFKGDPNAPVTLNMYSDFQCPFCARFFVNTEPGLVENYVRSGHVRLVFQDLPLQELHPNALAAHEVARCVAEQGAPLYWATYEALFMAQSEWAEAAEPTAIFQRLAGEVGADVDALNACVAAGTHQAAIAQSVADAGARGLDGTPSFLIDNVASGESYTLIGAQPYERFAEALDAVLAGNAPPVAAQPEQPSVPFWATAEGLTVDPDRPGYTMAGDQTRGSADAPVVVVEFSDFQCPYCKQHSEQTQPELDRLFVDTGDVRWVYKSFPLPIHPQAPAAGVAAECAADQGKFDEMHSALFARTGEWSNSNPSPVFIEIAGDLGLDTAAFATCLDDPAKAALVEADRADGMAYVQGTPTFIVLSGSGGRIIPGALPVSAFSAELQKAVDGQ
jgi:protein-disulfide isomerase